MSAALFSSVQGFTVNLGHMQGLPRSQTRTLEVCFESALRAQGDVDVLLPIEVPQVLGQAAGWAQQWMSPAPSTDFTVLLQVAKGPTYNIRLRATVVEPSLSLSKDTVQFSDILVGQCQIETVRLYNCFQVPCKWFIKTPKPVMKVKHRRH